MGKTTTEVDVYTCDNPKCNTTVMVPSHDEPAYGYHGQVTEIDSAGGRGGSFFACKPACIKGAAMEACENV